MSNKKRVKNFRFIDFTRYFLAFLCSFFIFTSGILIVLYVTLLQPTYLIQKAEKSDYYSLLTKEVNRYVQDVGLGSGIPEEVMENAISEQVVREQSETYFTRGFMGLDYDIDTTEIEEELTNKVKTYATQNQVDLTPESEEGIQFYLQKVTTDYRKFILLPYLVQIGMRVNQLRQIVLISAACSVVGLILGSLFLLKVLKWGHRLYRYLSYAFVGAGMMMIVFPVVILKSNYILRIGLTSKALYQFITTYLTDFFWGFIYGGVALILIGFVFIALSEMRRNRLISHGRARVAF